MDPDDYEPALVTAEVVLLVTWDANEYGPSCRTWNWAELVGCDQEECRVVGYRQVTP